MVAKTPEKIKQKKLIRETVVDGEATFNKTRSNSHDVKASDLLRKGMGRAIFNLYFINDFLQFLGTSTTNFVILLMKTVDTIT